MPGKWQPKVSSAQNSDVASFAVLEPTTDSFCSYFFRDQRKLPSEMPVDRANLLTLAVPEMTVLLGVMRALNANAGQSEHGVFTDRSGTLSNDFFVNLSDMSTRSTKSSKPEGVYGERDRGKGKLRCTATPVELVIGSNFELCAVAQV